MPRLSPVDAASPAFARIGAMLLHPFRLRIWLKMGFIGWLAGGLATASLNLNYRVPAFPTGQLPHDPWKDLNQAIRSIHFEQLAGFTALLVALLLIGLIVALIFTYLFSRFRFVLFESVVTGQVAVGPGWRRYRNPANRYFLFWLFYNLIRWLVVGSIVGLPLWRAYKSGVFQGDQPFQALFALLASIALGLLACGIVFAVISTLVKDFVMPLMALDDLPMGRAFSVLGKYISAEPGAWAGYFGMKLVFALAAGIGLGIASAFAFLILLIVLAIPAGLLIALGIYLLKISAILGIAVFVLTGLAVIAACFCMSFCLFAPISVFFAAYAFYFFGGRYPRLGALLWPEPAPPEPQMAVAAPGP